MKIKGLRWNEALLMRLCVLVALTLMGVCLVASAVLGILYLTAPDEPGAAVSNTNDPDEPYPSLDPNGATSPVNGGLEPQERLLAPTADAGQGYIDRMIFVGESTTAHLRSRGVLSGGTDTHQVWSNASNTMTLDLNILQKTIRYPVSGVEMTIPQAAASAKPELMVLSFGTNGIYGFEKNPELYRVAYGKLIEAIHEASPQTVVLLQTVYPVAANQTTFTDGAEAVNGYITKLNAMLPSIAREFDAYVVDTASCLTDARGLLRSDYQSGDGLHLTEDAYRAILDYLRTHAYAP